MMDAAATIAEFGDDLPTADAARAPHPLDSRVASQIAPRAPSDPAAANSVVLALVVTLLDLEQRGARGKVRPPMDRRRIA